MKWLLSLVAANLVAGTLSAQPALDFLNHGKPVLDAHNCYPYEGQRTDWFDRALQNGFPVGIEQDLAWVSVEHS